METKTEFIVIDPADPLGTMVRASDRSVKMVNAGNKLKSLSVGKDPNGTPSVVLVFDVP